MSAQVDLLDKDEVIKTLPAKFDAVVVGIDTLKERYAGLKIIGIDDKSGYEAVKSGISELRSKRTAIEDVRQTFKRPLLDIGSAIDAEAKRITLALVEIEEPLKLEKKRIDDEKDAIKAAKLAEEQRLIREEQEKIARAAREKAEAEAAAQAEKNRLLAEENARLKAEADRVAAEQKAIADAQAAEMAKMRAEKAAAEAETARLKHDAEQAKLAQEKAEADKLAAEKAAAEREEAEKARIAAEAEAKAKRIADELAAQERAKAEKAAKEAQLKAALEEREQMRAALAPDFEMLTMFSNMLLGLLPALDAIQNPVAIEFRNELVTDIANLQNKIINWIGE